MNSIIFLFLMGFFFCILTGCGVKAPPLPPLPVTPQASEMERPRPSPSPSGVSLREEGADE